MCYNGLMLTEDEADRLLTENQTLQATNITLVAENARLLALVSTLEARVVSLEARLATHEAADQPPPIKPSTPRPAPAPQPPRKKRAPEHNHDRRRATPTEIRTHAYDQCPTCAYPLRGQRIARRRAVLDLPLLTPVQVIEYQVLKRYCPACARWHEPELRLDGLVIGHGRLSTRLLALLAWLRTRWRLPVRSIRRYLVTRHALTLSVGEIVEVLHLVAATGKAALAALKAECRASPVLHMDETGWRAAGQNGYVWVMTTPSGVSYFHYTHSRAGAGARELSGAHYTGTLCTDFYAAYNDHACRHQRCWAHLLRDLEKLDQEAGATTAGLGDWIAAVRQLYRDGRTVDEQEPEPSAAARGQKADELERAAHKLGAQWAQSRGHPAQALCRRLLRHETELFQWVRQAGVEATNNRAERAIRPLAVARKISGGTQSADGSSTRLGLQSLFATWERRGENPLVACLTLLGGGDAILLPSS